MGNLSDLLKNPTSQVDTVAALVEAVLLDEQASDSNLASNLAGGDVGSVPIQSGPNATTFVASPTTSGHKFLLAWEPSGSAVEPAAIDVTSLGTLAAASSSNPIVDGTAAPGTEVTYARGDHVHPTDTSRVGGSGASGFIAQFDSDTSLKDSIIDYGVTAAEGLTAQNPGTGGTSILDSGGGGILIQDSATSGGGLKIKGSAGLSLISSNDSDESVTDSKILIISGDGLYLTNDPTTDLASAVTITNTGTGGLSLDGGAGGILVRPYLVPSSLYSAAGTPLPTPSSALIGAQAVVSDAVAPAYMAAYTGGALGVLCAVICDGTTWFTH